MTTAGTGGPRLPLPPTPDAGDDAPNGLFLGPIDDPDRFELMGRGRAGGEGVTWRGCFRGQLAAPVVVAVKQLRRPAAASLGWPTPADVQRWTDQRHLLQALAHQHIVRVHDIFLSTEPHPGGAPAEAGGLPCLVMEWVDGPDLRFVTTSGAADLTARLQAVRDIAAALTSLHSATRTLGNPMVHRDVKPDNVIVSPGRGGVLVDIGTLRPLDDARDPLGMHSRHYTAPEALADIEAPRTAACDVYGLGALAWFCVVGEDPPPADEPGAAEALRIELRAAVRRLRLPDPGGFCDRLLAAVDADPARRPTRPLRWADDLLARVRARRGRRRRRALVAATAVVGLLGVGVTLRPAAVAPAPQLPAFAAFGQSYAPYKAAVNGDRITITPPLGDNRFDHLWGVYAPAEACASTVEFDVAVDTSAHPTAYGIAVAPRAHLEADEPAGASVQYEWEDAADFGIDGSFARPAELPGGAWRATVEPQAMPDVRAPHHVVVRTIGTTMAIDVDGTAALFDVPAVECGGVALRVWGVPAVFSPVQISGPSPV